MRAFLFWLALGSTAIAQTSIGPPLPPIPGAVKGNETDAMRANDAACLAKFKALNAPLHGLAMIKFMRDCKTNGP